MIEVIPPRLHWGVDATAVEKAWGPTPVEYVKLYCWGAWCRGDAWLCKRAYEIVQYTPACFILERDPALGYVYDHVYYVHKRNLGVWYVVYKMPNGWIRVVQTRDPTRVEHILEEFYPTGVKIIVVELDGFTVVGVDKEIRF